MLLAHDLCHWRAGAWFAASDCCDASRWLWKSFVVLSAWCKQLRCRYALCFVCNAAAAAAAAAADSTIAAAMDYLWCFAHLFFIGFLVCGLCSDCLFDAAWRLEVGFRCR